ncbi:TonB-dependent receptor domain-containing protein [Sphingobium nicotianae]|uniref:TonB-dependent receptor n=1 Tax=Sphingobium nicotianae TaxID=2782607 RepID=A0A9X1ISI8_9SPHN|nr:TonB-dependent receptor [Sphingobium nicotianae]MBT2188339.1 TonB-dependent receptor [Sphingobium nicotianae]
MASAPALAQNESAAAADEAATATDSEIIVTGSRISRRDYSSDSPIATVSSETLQNTSAVSIDQQLNKMPQFVAGANERTSATDVQPNPTSSPGIATANLRGLGPNRTLVLLDGRRTQPANASLAVDLNTIPKAALDGVEIITGGAGATYGADAVAGVVNFKLKRHFTGVAIDSQAGVTSRGDGQQYDASILVGSDFADDRGNAMLGIGWSKRDPVSAIDRSFFSDAFSDPDSATVASFPFFYGYQPANAANYSTNLPHLVNSPTQAAIDAAFAGVPGYVPGDVTAAGSTYLFFNPSQTLAGTTLFTNIHGLKSGIFAPGYKGSVSYPLTRTKNNRNAAGAITSRDLYPNGTEAYIALPLTRYSMFGNAYYDVTPDITVYVQGNFNQTNTKTRGAQPSAAYLQWGVSVPYDSATCGAASGHPVPGTLCNVLNSRPFKDDPWQLAQPLDFLGSITTDNTVYTYEVLTGLRGRLGLGDWTFDAFASHGRTSQEVLQGGVADQARYQALINSPNFGAGQIFQNFRLGTDAKCTSGLNPFTQGQVSQDCIDIISANLKTTSSLTQNQAEADFQGTLLDLPAGPVKLALGADYRENRYVYRPDDGINGNNIVSSTVGLFDTKPVDGKVSVSEFYAEILVPVLKDLPFVKSLDLDAGYRHSNYNTAGGVSTWKVTGNWKVNDIATLRGGYQRASRAPNVAELFQPGIFSTVTWTEYDPCSNTHTGGYGNTASNPNRQKVIDLCNALPGMPGPVVNTAFTGNFTFNFGLGRDQTLGNPDLKPEEASTITGGLVLQTPGMTPVGRFQLTVDYYNIKIAGAIAPATTQFVYQQCFNADGASNPSYDPKNAFCQLILRRAPDGGWASTTAKFLNFGKIATAGWDVTLNWAIPAPAMGGEQGAFNASVNFNYLDKYEVQGTPNAPVYDYANSSSPTSTTGLQNPPFGSQFRWKTFSTFGWDFGPGSLSLNWRHTPKTRNVARVTQPTATQSDTAAYDLFGLAGRVSIQRKFEVRFGIDNLFDRQPPRVGVNETTPVVGSYASASGVTDSGAYDVVGRSFYLGVKVNY